MIGRPKANLELSEVQRRELEGKINLAEIQLTGREASRKTFSIKKIVVALGMSLHSEATAYYALGLAKTFGTSLVLIHVYEPIQMNEFISIMFAFS